MTHELLLRYMFVYSYKYIHIIMNIYYIFVSMYAFKTEYVAYSTSTCRHGHTAECTFFK